MIESFLGRAENVMYHQHAIEAEMCAADFVLGYAPSEPNVYLSDDIRKIDLVPGMSSLSLLNPSLIAAITS